MIKKDMYARGCLFAINSLIEKGSSAFGVKVDGRWETIPWYEITEWIEKITSAQPKKGMWEMKPDPFGFFHDVPVCSECGCMTTFREKTMYCPNCGADMRGECE